MTKDMTRISIAAAAISLSLIAGAPQRASAETIKLTTQEWKPYQSVTNGQLDGIAVKAVTCILDKMGHKAEFSVLPWNRAQKEVADGAAGGFFAASKSADRDAFAEMSQPFIPQVWKWYSQAGKTVDVSNKATKVGVLAGSSMEKWLEENGFSAPQKLQNTDALVKMLQSGRIEAALANEIVFKDAVAGAGATEAGFTAAQHSDRPLGVYFSKVFLASHPGFLEGFNAQIKACQ
ncbi:MAG TPA: transporter substrate-binding domain-containing protein [Magnetospirillum sp.]|nr:transporter substrate-binding domain-containing protein [Magnetospirillum sp.]